MQFLVPPKLQNGANLQFWGYQKWHFPKKISVTNFTDLITPFKNIGKITLATHFCTSGVGLGPIHWFCLFLARVKMPKTKIQFYIGLEVTSFYFQQLWNSLSPYDHGNYHHLCTMPSSSCVYNAIIIIFLRCDHHHQHVRCDQHHDGDHHHLCTMRSY